MVQQSSHVILSANRSQVGWTNISGHSFVDWKPCRSSRRAHTRCATPWSRSRWSPWLAVLVEGSRDDGPISWNMVAIFLGNMIRYAAYHKADCTIPLRSSDHQIIRSIRSTYIIPHHWYPWRRCHNISIDLLASKFCLWLRQHLSI